MLEIMHEDKAIAEDQTEYFVKPMTAIPLFDSGGGNCVRRAAPSSTDKFSGCFSFDHAVGFTMVSPLFVYAVYSGREWLAETVPHP